MQYRRYRFDGGCYFFTLVTFERRPILCESQNVALLRTAFRKVMKLHPFGIDAFVLLPDHLHCLWKMPDGDSDFPLRWRLIKTHFTRGFGAPFKTAPSDSRNKKGELAVWQRRYWEHLIRDEDDLAQHLDYIHYNPVKHGWVEAAIDWPYSSFHRYVKEGRCDPNFGSKGEITFPDGIGME